MKSKNWDSDSCDCRKTAQTGPHRYGTIQEELDDNAYGVPISGIIRAYNSMFIQPDPFFSAELNYYKSFRSAYDFSFETGDYSKETAKIGGAFDVTAALKETVKTQLVNSFQSYMD